MIKLDQMDLKILETLQWDGRISKTKLAEQVNLSVSPTWERLKRLEEAGVVRGYRADIDGRKLAPITMVLVEIALSQHQNKSFELFEKNVKDVPEIVECYSIGGGMDYLMKVITKDVDSYQRLMDRLLNQNIGIDRYFSYIVTKPVKESCTLPLQALTKNSDR